MNPWINLPITELGIDEEIFENLPVAGATVNSVDGITYHNALQAAACKGNKTIVNDFVANGVDVNSSIGQYGSTR